ncbi:type II toxin-antitoxin system RatA family toxin [Candidatus Thiosymbion oneisti]|uniref:type II toxin-antitoxin system RatA family toxin n=1 Tax=Candidatus Thiosymbion oneisti TaxID=589554 RepID=UPI000A49CC55|nr:type II toxin-antitoxin system RatA family toxin [Candidatus Thiosymbion oneisti]
MPVITKSALVTFSASRMFDLVAQMEDYPKFLPWCAAAEILSREDNRICGRMEVARAGIHQTFTTCNRFVPGERMELMLVDGPFRKLQGAWTFRPLRRDACKVELELDFEFSGKLIDKAFGRVFNQIANTLVDAFCKRAEEVYRD